MYLRFWNKMKIFYPIVEYFKSENLIVFDSNKDKSDIYRFLYYHDDCLNKFIKLIDNIKENCHNIAKITLSINNFGLDEVIDVDITSKDYNNNNYNIFDDIEKIREYQRKNGWINLFFVYTNYEIIK